MLHFLELREKGLAGLESSVTWRQPLICFIRRKAPIRHNSFALV